MTAFGCETIPRARGLEEGLAARVGDPLWFVTRQWQMGELHAEDAASLAHVDVTVEHHPVDQWRAGPATVWSPYDRARQPLEAMVEAEPPLVSPRLRIEGGLQLRRMLNDAGLGDDTGAPAAFVRACPFPPLGPEARGSVDDRVRRRLPDGAALAAFLHRLFGFDGLPEAAALALPPEVHARVLPVGEAWLTWWQERAPAPAAGPHPATWDENRLEHRLALRASTLPDVELRADEYPGGRLDWWALDAVTVAPDGPGGAPRRYRSRSVPGPATFGGMPVARFWEMEDARIDFGSVDAGPLDLGRMLMIGFATVYSNDWFVLPVPLPAASLMRFTRFRTTDVFGRTAELGPSGAAVDGWNLFGTTDASVPPEPGVERPTSPWWYLAAALPDVLEGPAIETVELLRDEMANLAWAVEAEVADDAGRVVAGHDTWLAQAGATAAEPAPDPALPRYRVDTDVPDHWFPLTPEQASDRTSVWLHLVPLARRRDGQHVPPQLPAGILLATARGGDVWLHEEEVPRAGVVVTRAHQRARWHDGSAVTWIGRRKATGHGEGSSGLRFDVLE